MTSLVWVYWHGGAASDELRWSMRSATACFGDGYEPFLVGDRPPWYVGEWICQPRVPYQFRRKWVDCIAKLQRIIDSPQISEEFVWLYDDQHFLARTSIDEWRVPRCFGRYRIPDLPHNAWQQIRFDTYQMLQELELPIWDYATHAPHVFSKSRLQKIIDEFGLHESPLLPESAYGNVFFGDGRQFDGEFKMVDRPGEIGPDTRIISHGHGFQPCLREYLTANYSKKPDFEI